MTTFRFALLFGLGFGWLGAADAQVRSIQETTDEGGRVRVETTETRDATGRRLEVETQTDAHGWRKTIARVLDVRGNENATSGDLPVEANDGAPTFGTGWHSIGPDGGDIRALAVSPRDPQTILAGLLLYNYNGTSLPFPALYRSTDGGATWHPVLSIDRLIPYISETGAYDLQFSSDGIAYAATSSGLWKSTDGGERWARLTPSGFDVRAFAIEPGTGRFWIGLRTGAIHRSATQGSSWEFVRAPASAGQQCRAIAFDAARPGYLAVCFGNLYSYPDRQGEVWLSPNGGASWLNRTSDLPDALMNDVVFHNGALYVGGGNDYIYPWAGVYVSTDDGVRWSGQNAHWPFQSRTVRDIEFDPVQPCVMWVATPAGIFRSNDCGASFSFFIGHSRHSVSKIVVVPGSDRVLAGSEYGFLERQGLGDFELEGRGIRDLGTSVVAQNPADPREIAVAFQRNNTGGVYTTRDHGEHWTLEGTLRARITNVAFDRNGVLYAVCEGPTFVNEDGVHRREANGTWTFLGPEMDVFAQTSLQWLKISQTDPRVILVGGGDYTNNGFALAVWRTTDGGQHWQKVLRQAATYYSLGDGLLLEDGANRTMLASLPTDVGRLWRSTDGGTTWAPVAGGLPPYGPRSLSSRSSDPNRVVVAMGQLYESLDAGVTWRTIFASQLPNTILCDPNDARVLYGISTSLPPFGNPLRSTDGGRTMEPFDQSLSAAAYHLLVGAGECPDLLAATSSGVWARSVSSPPTITARSNVTTLWPPNHQMVDVHFDVTAASPCDASVSFVLANIACDDPGSAGDIEGATIGSPDTDFRLRATRSGNDASRIYTITYRALDASGNRTDVVRVIEVPHDRSGVQADHSSEDETSAAGDLPTVTALTGVSPSPFAASTTVSFDLVSERAVRVRVLDVRGAVVRTLADGVTPAGRHRLAWDGRDRNGHALPNGVYFVAFEGAERAQGRRIVLLR